jgi:hypothetical protein
MEIPTVTGVGRHQDPFASADHGGMVPCDRRILFPALLFLGNVGSAIACFASGDWRRGLYWAASSICIASVTI